MKQTIDHQWTPRQNKHFQSTSITNWSSVNDPSGQHHKQLNMNPGWAPSVRLYLWPPPNLNDPQPKHQTSKSRDLKAPRTKAGGSTLTVYTSPMVMLSTYMLIKCITMYMISLSVHVCCWAAEKGLMTWSDETCPPISDLHGNQSQVSNATSHDMTSATSNQDSAFKPTIIIN